MDRIRASDIFGFLIILAVVWFVVYGLETDCPDTAGYVSCAAME